MEIIDEREKRKLGDLFIGDLFVDGEGDVCMVVEYPATSYYEREKVKFIDLKDGSLYEEAKCERVEKVTGKLYIED